MVEKRDGNAIALRRIAEEAERRTGTLDLSGLGLTQLPLALFELKHLHSLDLGSYPPWIRRLDGSFDTEAGTPNAIASDIDKLRHLSSLIKLTIERSDVFDLAFVRLLPALKSLNCSRTQAASLDPLAGLSALQSLNCSFTQVTSLDPLAGLTALRSLNCSGTQVASLDPLAGLTALQSLECSCTQVASLDPLAGLTALQLLDCSETQVASLEPLAGLTALQSLNCWRTQVASLEPLAGLTALQSLNCSGTQVASLEPLAGLTALQSLDCSGTLVASLQPLVDLAALQSLNCWRTQVASLESLAGLTALQSLDCSGTLVASLQPLTGLTALQSLTFSDTRVASLQPLTGLTALQSLTFSDTRVASLQPLTGLTALQSLTFSDTRVASLQPLTGLTALQSLTFSDTRVASLQPLTGLTALQSLTCWSTHIASLGPLAGLTALQSLNCSYTQVASLEPIAGLAALQWLTVSATQVASLEPLAGLTALQSLDCWETQIASLEPLAGLTALQSLTFSDTRVASLEPLSGLTALQSLFFSATQVASLEPLAGLTALQGLNCSKTPVASLEPLAGLTALQSLYCSQCDLLSFPDAVLRLPNLRTLILFETSIPGIPAEVMSASGADDCREKLRAHLDDLAAGALPLPDVKLMLLGNGKAGKTQLSNRLRDIPFNPDWDSTHGIVVADAELQVGDDEKPAILHIWDFGGQDIYHGTHALFARSRAVFAVIWSKETESTGEYERDGIRFRNRPLAYWVEYARQHGVGESPILIVQTKCDSAADEERPFPMPDSTPGVYRQDVHYSARSNRRRAALDDALGAAIEWLRDPGRQGQPVIGVVRLRIRRRLEALRNEDATRPTNEHRHRTVAYADVERMCAEEGGVASVEQLLVYLNDAGVVFYRKGLFGDRIILDQAWALEAIYAVFQRQRSYRRLVNVRGRFNRELLELLAWDGYPVPEQRLFLSMMVSCGICFVHRRARDPDDIEYIAPDLLPERSDVAGELAEKWPADQPFEHVSWRYTLLHPGLIRDVIAHVGTRAGVNALYWRDGVSVYELTTHSRAIVEQEKNGEWGGTLRLRTQGPQAATLLERLEELIVESQQRIGLMPAETTRSLPERPTKVIETLEPRRVEEPKPPELKFGEPPRAGKGWFVSYAWADQTPEGQGREADVDRLCREAENAGFRIERDNKSMTFGDSISRFMARLGEGDRIFIFLSDKYLKSPWCMTELHAIWRTSRADPDTFFKRVRVYKLPDARYESIADRIACARHWADQYASHLAEVKTHADLVAKRDFAAFKQMGEFHFHVADILAEIADRVRPLTFDDFIKYGFGDPPLH